MSHLFKYYDVEFVGGPQDGKKQSMSYPLPLRLLFPRRESKISINPNPSPADQVKELKVYVYEVEGVDENHAIYRYRGEK